MKQLEDSHRGVVPLGVQMPDDGIDTTLNLTYRFTSRTSPRADNSHVLSVHTVVDEFPTTPEARGALVSAYGPYLVQEWTRRGLPSGELFSLIHRPGELGPAEGPGGQGSAGEYGGVPVVVALANTAQRPGLVVSRVRVD